MEQGRENVILEVNTGRKFPIMTKHSTYSCTGMQKGEGESRVLLCPIGIPLYAGVLSARTSFSLLYSFPEPCQNIYSVENHTLSEASYLSSSPWSLSINISLKGTRKLLWDAAKSSRQQQNLYWKDCVERWNAFLTQGKQTIQPDFSLWTFLL